MAFNGWTFLSLATLLAGVGFWLYMGVNHDNWTDVGVYSIGVTLTGLGLVGTFVSAAKPSSA